MEPADDVHNYCALCYRNSGMGLFNYCAVVVDLALMTKQGCFCYYGI